MRNCIEKIKDLFLSTESVVVELECMAFTTSDAEWRGMEKVRRQLSKVLRSLAPENVVCARISGDRFVLSFSPTNGEEVSRLLRHIQNELVALMQVDVPTARVGLDHIEMSGADASVALHKLQLQRDLIQTVRQSAACLN